MSGELVTVLQIALTGSALLFVALAGLIGLMYLLTAPGLFRAAAPADTSSLNAEESDARAEKEEERQRHAVALAVALACAGKKRPAAFAVEAPSEWRRVHLGRRLSQRAARMKGRA